MKKLLLVFTLLTSSCYQKPNKLRINALPYNLPLKDCDGIMIRMRVLNIHENLNPGSDFARVIAVDKLDGTMSVKILPPPDGAEFPLKEGIHKKKLKFIACYENPNSIKNGAYFSGTCLPTINILGGVDDVSETHLDKDGFKAKVCDEDGYCKWINVHDTRNPYKDANYYIPTSIMFVAFDDTNPNKDYIVAIGDSPYKACYFGN